MKKDNKKTLFKLFLFNGLLLLACFVFLEWIIREQAAFNPVLTGDMAKMKMVEMKPDVSEVGFLQIGYAKTAPRKISQFKNEWLVVNFWATWCAPCIKEMPTLEKLQEKYAGKGLRVMAIAMDDDLHEEQLKSFLARHKIGGLVPQYWDHDGAIYQSFRFAGYPTTWIVDPYGRRVAYLEGDANWADEHAFAFFDSLLGIEPEAEYKAVP